MNLPEILVDESTLTPRQLETLGSYLRVALGEMTYREAAAAAGQTKKVTVGAYYRTVQQARRNIRGSIVTLLIALWLGVIKPEDVRRLVDAVSGERVDLSEEEAGRFAAVLHALLHKVVM